MPPTIKAVLLLLVATGALAAPFDAELLVDLRRISDPRVSPDGSHVAFVVRETDRADDRGRTGLWLARTDGSKPPYPLTGGTGSDKQPRFSADGEYLYFLSRRTEPQALWRMPVGEPDKAEQLTDLGIGLNAYALVPTDGRVVASIDVFQDCEDLACTRMRLDEDETRADSAKVHDRLFARHWDQWEDGRRATLFAFDPSSAASPVPLTAGLDAHVPARPFGGAGEFAVSADGKSVFFSARSAPGSEKAWSTNLDIYRVPPDGSAPPENLTADLPGTEAEPTPSPDGRLLAFSSMARPGFEADRQRLLVLDLESGRRRELAAESDRSFGKFAFSADSTTIYATGAHLGQRALFAIGVRDGEAILAVAEGYVSAVVTGGSRVVVARDDLASPTDLYRLDGTDMRRLTSINEEKLAGVEFGDFEQFTFAGWSDETVHGYMVKPVGFDPDETYPLAFLIHGGPQGSFGNHFHYRWNPQTYAGQGYVAVMIDFHGSTGYGQAFTDAISGDWGGKPLVDLQKGLAAALARYPFIDGERACALGASYGGYMINWIAGNWPGRFDCLVNHDGIFDNRMMYYTTEELWFDEWEMGGPQFEVPANYELHNPVAHVDRWRDPMLVIHGALDYRVPDTQGLAAFTALQRRGIPSRLMVFPDENHWVLRPSNSVRWHREVERWLARWTGERPPE